MLDLNTERKVILHWVGGHIGITGNEIADRVANMGHKQDKSYITYLSREEQLVELKYLYNQFWNQYWKEEVNITQKGKFLRGIMDNINKQQIIKFKERRIEVIFHRLRIGHVGLKQYLYRFNMATDEECNYCKRIESVEHYLLKCNKYDRQRETLVRDLGKEGISRREINIKILLGGGEYNIKKNRKILTVTKNYIKETDRVDEL